MEIEGIDIKWLGHAGFLITNSVPQTSPDKLPSDISTKGKIIYIDPYNIKTDSQKADLILITHSHYDHCSVADMEKIIQEGTRIVMTADCQSKVFKI